MNSVEKQNITKRWLSPLLYVLGFFLLISILLIAVNVPNFIASFTFMRDHISVECMEERRIILSNAAYFTSMHDGNLPQSWEDLNQWIAVNNKQIPLTPEEIVSAESGITLNWGRNIHDGSVSRWILMHRKLRGEDESALNSYFLDNSGWSGTPNEAPTVEAQQSH